MKKTTIEISDRYWSLYVNLLLYYSCYILCYLMITLYYYIIQILKILMPIRKKILNASISLCLLKENKVFIILNAH